MKKATTEDRLRAALARMLSGETENVSPTSKLSVSSVEKEAGLGNGSAYHYSDVVKEIKTAISEKTGKPVKPNKMSPEREAQLKETLNEEKRLKNKYRDEMLSWKARAESLAAQLHEANAAP